MVRARAIAKRIAAVVGLVVAVLYGSAIALRVLYPVAYLDLVRAAADERGLDAAALCSLIRAESRFHPGAVSARGAIGLMQIMPDTGLWIAEQIGLAEFVPAMLFDPRTNLRLGTWYLRYLLDRFGGLEPALMSYHAGPTRVDGWLASGEIPYSGTRATSSASSAAVPIYQAVLRWPIVVRITPSLPL